MKKKRMIMIVAMVLVLVWREDVFAVESGTTQVSLQADWLQEGDYQYSVEEDETVTLRNYIGTESVPEKRQKTFRHAFLRPILIPSCSELTQNKNTIII